MEKELFISTLKEKTGVDNLSERTIDEVATMFLPQFADDSKIDDDLWKLPIQIVKTMSGQLRHDLSGGITAFKTQFETDNKAAQEKAIADAIAKAKEEWEKNKDNGGGGGGDNHDNQNQDNQDVDKKIADAIAKAINGITGEEGAIGKLSKQFSDYMTQVNAEKKEQQISNIRNQVKDYLIDLGVDEDDYALEITLEKLEIGDNPDVSSLKKKAKTDYEAIYKRMHKGESVQPFRGGGGGSDDTDKEFKDFIKNRQDAAAQEAKDAEELRKHMM